MFEKDKLPVLGILRGIDESNVRPLVSTCIDSGISYIEITMNTQGAAQLIHQMIDISFDKLVVGAGTVINMDSLDKALEAGAKFIVCPAVVESVIKKCVQLKVPVFPGALTPTEVQRAWDLGATMVKLFPASVFGPSYINELKGPFNTTKIMAVGGITEHNINAYFSNGADAVAFGASIFKIQWLAEGRYEFIKEKIISLIKNYKNEKIA